MQIDVVVTGVLDENCYILKKDGKCLVIDPGDDYPLIKEKIGDDKVIGVLITHSHFDHVGALRNFLSKRSIKIFKKSMVEEEKEIEIGPFKFIPYYTPGHAKDSVTYYFKDDNALFVGDFIFKGSIGRCDFPGGSYVDMKKSIKILNNFPEEAKVYPGHGDSTVLGEELKTNKCIKEIM